MQKNPILAAAIALQIVFTLACVGGGASVDGNQAGADVRLDDAGPPTVPERPDLVGDHRCDWLGAPFASSHSERVFVLRSTDRGSDCDGANEAESKVIYSLAGGGVRPLMDVTALNDVRMLEAEAGLVVLSEDEDLETAWLFDADTKTVLREAQLPVRIRRTVTSPTGAWVAVGNAGQVMGQMGVYLLDPATLELSFLTGEGRQGDYAWAADQVLVTAEYDEHSLRIAEWDLSQGVPSAPVFETTIQDRMDTAGMRQVLNPPQVVVSPDARFVAVPSIPEEGSGGELILVDRRTRATTVVADVIGPLAFSADGRVIGRRHSEEGVVIVDPSTGQVEVVDLQGEIEFIPSDSGPHVLVYANRGMVRLHLDTLELTQLEGAGIRSYTVRDGEIWMVDAPGVRRFNLDQGTQQLHRFDDPTYTVWASSLDQIYLGVGDAPTAHMLDPETGAIVTTYDLVGDIVGSPTRIERATR